jgi:23S rRNA (cytosine1962-C5)-methyltransferase
MELRKSELLSGVAPPDGYLVRQNGVTVAVDLVEGQHTGIFLDMRTVRRKLLPYYGSVGTMLNLFSYTAVFSVHALLNGAKHA